ncbi:TIR domain-containing protein [Opitutus sp. GAS368]|uniref:TIR domain-containing protein n=1 Tax=Opitutus sp. GAS368 TaxID=1882749 RepID=UPI00087A91EA|nr:TIR domain-containing protein [Opitutus sp. GAS368]SDR83250.1 TolB amino-terminal domain-containing protein [Opitutus sp. GAS368]
MSEPGKAVFLSYASQDSEAAKRIADALRAAGVEVWFDQSELVGGDAWDAKIRKQIKECALLIPIISANTQQRTEGYFRLEWRLADQRTHLMATGRAFLLPVVIDDTRDAEAHVPDSFTEVQWTRLPGGETPPAFTARVRKLLSGAEIEPGRPRPGHETRGEVAAPPGSRGPSRWWWVLPIFGVTMALLLVMKEGRKEPPPVVAPSASSTQAETEQLRRQIVPDRWQQEDFQAMAPRLDRIIRDDPDNADAWALRSLIESLQVTRNFDAGTKPLEAGKNDADRALRLAPQSPLASLAMGMHLVAMISRGGDAQACRPWLDRAVGALPASPLTRYCGGVSRWLSYDFAESEREMHAWIEAEPHAGFPNWILAQLNMVARRPDQAEQFATEAARDDGITGIRARYTLFESSYYLRADLARSREILQGIPAGGSTVHRVVHARWLVAMAGHRWDDALQELARLPENFLFDRAFHGPKALLAGMAHARAGRADAANAQFREAERLLREHLAADPDNEELHAVLAVALACLGQADAARSELALVEPLVSGRAANVYRGSLVIQIAQVRCLLGDYSAMATWVRKLFAEKSAFPFTPASFALDPRFSGGLDAPGIRALLQEFAALAPAQASSDGKSVAVLAFANLSDDKANEYFSDGISEELLNVLAKIPGLKVSARTSAFYFKGKEVPVPEIARQLGVAYVVEGSVRRQGDKVRITAQLIKAADGFHVWSDTFTRDLKDIFAVQDEIAGLIAKNLSLKMGMVAARPTVDLEAYQEYLTGKALFAKASNNDLRAAVGHFEKAVAIEPGFTAAWVQLASAHTRLGRWGGTPTLQAWAAARAAIDKARALEPESPEVLLALGWILRTAEWDWRGAEQAFRRTLQLQPNQPDALAGAAVLLFNIGKTEEAYRLAQQAVELDPLNASTQIDLSIMFYMNKNWAEAERTARQALQLAPGGSSYRSILAWGLIGQWRYAEAEAEIAQDRDGIDRINAKGLLALARGQEKVARDQLAQLEGESRADGDLADLQQSIAWLCACLGEKDRAFAALERAAASRDPSMAWLINSWYLEPLYSDPRWPVLVRKLGLADDQLKQP